jgi:glycosyltransferase involved in cell wall biosynthesis
MARTRARGAGDFGSVTVRLTVVNVAFPFAPVTTDPVGGAEQVVALLDRTIVARGHRSIVIASQGSQSAGELVCVPVFDPVDEASRARVYDALRTALTQLLARERIDLVHLHGLDFANYLPPAGCAALVTLHLSADWYAPQTLLPARPRTWLNPVSRAQARTFPPLPTALPPIENGVDVAAFVERPRKRDFALALGRMCFEKGYHEALEAAHLANFPLLLAGAVFPYEEHRRYFSQEIRPRLDRTRRWIGAVAGARKRRLLAAARCVLVPSLALESSSLVAMEALAAGTPVIAYRRGALADIVEHGRTGFLVDSPRTMALAIRAAGDIDPETCRRAARRRFDSARMAEDYLTLYARLARGTESDGGAGQRL